MGLPGHARPMAFSLPGELIDCFKVYRLSTMTLVHVSRRVVRLCKIQLKMLLFGSLKCRFVEGMAPVFSRAAWHCAWHLIQVMFT